MDEDIHGFFWEFCLLLQHGLSACTCTPISVNQIVRITQVQFHPQVNYTDFLVDVTNESISPKSCNVSGISPGLNLRKVFLNDSDQVLWSPMNMKSPQVNAIENNKDLLPQIPYESKWSQKNSIESKANKYGYKNSEALIRKLRPVLPKSRSEGKFIIETHCV